MIDTLPHYYIIHDQLEGVAAALQFTSVFTLEVCRTGHIHKYEKKHLREINKYGIVPKKSIVGSNAVLFHFTGVSFTVYRRTICLFISNVLLLFQSS